jgi:hypothetical protein
VVLFVVNTPQWLPFSVVNMKMISLGVAYVVVVCCVHMKHSCSVKLTIVRIVSIILNGKEVTRKSDTGSRARSRHGRRPRKRRVDSDAGRREPYVVLLTRVWCVLL